MAKTAGAKTKVYSKYGKEIYVSAKNGSTDPDSNLSLRRLIEKAKKDQVPTHVIEKAIEKAKGAGGEDYAHATLLPAGLRQRFWLGSSPHERFILRDCCDFF